MLLLDYSTDAWRGVFDITMAFLSGIGVAFFVGLGFGGLRDRSPDDDGWLWAWTGVALVWLFLTFGLSELFYYGR